MPWQISRTVSIRSDKIGDDRSVATKFAGAQYSAMFHFRPSRRGTCFREGREVATGPPLLCYLGVSAVNQRLIVHRCRYCCKEVLEVQVDDKKNKEMKNWASTCWRDSVHRGQSPAWRRLQQFIGHGVPVSTSRGIVEVRRFGCDHRAPPA